MSTRIELIEVDGQWVRPDCKCAFHYWDGQPDIRTYYGGDTHATGKVAPHVHLCQVHAAATAPAARVRVAWSLEALTDIIQDELLFWEPVQDEGAMTEEQLLDSQVPGETVTVLGKSQSIARAIATYLVECAATEVPHAQS